MENSPEEMLLNFDCILEMFVRDIESIKKMQQDEEFVSRCLSDHGNFADITRCKYVDIVSL